MKLVEGIIPDRESKYGRAWRTNLTAARADSKTTQGDDATVCCWVVEAKWAHPVWANYCIFAISLRPCKYNPDPHIALPGVTHEIFLYALSPDVVPNLLSPCSTRLTPINFTGQWIAGSDIDAEEKIEKCVDLMLAGRLSPDTDFLHQWVGLFSDSAFKK